MMDEEVQNMTATEADVLKMPSKMMEAAELPMLTETREGALKMVAEAPKKLETEAGELNLMESEAGVITAAKASTEGGGVTLSSHMQWRRWRKKIPSSGRNTKPPQKFRLQQHQQ